MPKTDTILSAKSLRYFLQLIDTMNYTQAAQILGITQPALTQQIKKLEHAIGTPFFGQTGKKIYLTEAGKQMQSAAVKLLDTINSVVDDIQEFTQADKGTISIGILDNLDFDIFRQFIIQFSKKYPNIHLNVITCNREKLWQRLDNNTVDITIMYLPDNTKRDKVNLQHQYNNLKIYEDRLVILTHKNTVEKNGIYPISRFYQRKWIAYPENDYLTRLMKEYFGHKNKMSISLTFPKIDYAVKSAEATENDTFVAYSYYKTHKKEINLTPVFVKSAKKFEISLVYRKGKLEIPRIKNLIKEWNKFLDKANYSSRLVEEND